MGFCAFAAARIVELLQQWQLRQSLGEPFSFYGDNVLCQALDPLLQGGGAELLDNHHHPIGAKLRSIIPETFCSNLIKL